MEFFELPIVALCNLSIRGIEAPVQRPALLTENVLSRDILPGKAYFISLYSNELAPRRAFLNGYGYSEAFIFDWQKEGVEDEQ